MVWLKAIRILLSLVLILPLALKTAVVIDWAVHQDYIAENLCENRDRPEMHCNGKCVLMQKMDMADDFSDEQVPLSEVARIEIPAFLVYDGLSYNASILTVLSRALPTFKEEFYTHVLTFDIFHPPRF